MPAKSNRAGGGEVRLQVYLARAGIASRRASEELIATGRVFVNGTSITTPGTKVRPGTDRVEVDGRPVETVGLTWLALHKPRGYVTTRHDPWDRKTIYELLPDRFASLFHVGRLDRDSEGLLLLTNDGERANRMLHPRFGTTKEYLVDVEGEPEAATLRELEKGVQLDDGLARAEQVRRMHQTDNDVFRLRIVLREGKKREIRRMLSAVGHPVRRLIRRRFGPVELGELPSGKWRVLGPTELNALDSRKLAPRDSAEAAADEAPDRDARPARASRPKTSEDSPRSKRAERERPSERSRKPERPSRPAKSPAKDERPKRSEADSAPRRSAGAPSRAARGPAKPGGRGARRPSGPKRGG